MKTFEEQILSIAKEKGIKLRSSKDVADLMLEIIDEKLAEEEIHNRKYPMALADSQFELEDIGRYKI